jgi:1,2-diacylglycerol 3-alpha-glucosyltransferase
MDSPLRIAIFGESYLPYRSGVTVATQALADGLSAAGHRVLLVVPRPASGASAQPVPSSGPTASGPEIAWLPSYQGPPPAPPSYRMPIPRPSVALRRARELRPDVVHAQSPFVSGLMARRIARSVGAPLVFTHHTRFADYRHYLGPLAAPGAWLTQAYLAAYWAGCAAIVAPSTDLADEIGAALHGSRRPIVRAIPTGLDLQAVAALVPVDPRPLAGWPAESLVVVSVGRLAREKSVDLLLEAFARAAEGDPRLRLLLIGSGPLESELAARANRGVLQGLVHLTGGLPRPQALAMAAGSDLFAFASRTETQGLVLAEALAMGLPVVTLEGPGVRDAVRDGVDGIVVARSAADAPGLDRERLTDAIGALAADRARRASLAAAARDGAYRFDLGLRIGEVVALYREVIAHG